MRVVKLFRNTALRSFGHQLRHYVSRDIGQHTHYSHPDLIAENEILPGITKTEFADRRQRLIEELSKTHYGMLNPKHLVIIPAATLRYMTHDIFHRFHQNNDFLYFTGLQEPDSVLVMDCANNLPQHKSILYVTPRNPIKEQWEGPLIGPDDAVSFLGVDEAYDMNLLAKHLEERYSKEGYSVWYYGEREIPSIISDAVAYTISKNLLQLPGAKVTSMHSLLHHIQNLRVVKSSSEIELLKKAGKIAVNAYKQTIPITRPGMYEFEIESKFEHSCRIQGAQRLSFVPVVAGGHRGCHLHYTTNQLKLSDGNLILVDAGCEYFGYVSDVTRTWPVNGTFTLPQRELYEAVLRVKNTCIECCKPGVTLNYLHSISKEAFAVELKALGIIPMDLDGSVLANVINGLYPHDIGHYLGLDVHDCPLLSHNASLVPGMVLTIEPGVYIQKSFGVKRKEFQGIAIRIEDNVVVTTSGCEVLNSGCPETVEEISKLML